MTAQPYKLLIFAMAFPPAGVGSGMYAYRLAHTMRSKGVTVRVLASADPAGAHRAFDAQEDLEIIRMPWSEWVPLRYRIGRQWLARMLKEWQPDSLWTTNGMATRVAGLLPQDLWQDIPLVSCMRGTDVVVGLPGKGLLGRLESIPLRRAYRASRQIAAASQYLKAVGVAKGIDGDRIFTNSSVFDFSLFTRYTFDAKRLYAQHPFLPGRDLILTVGRLSQQKRTSLAIDAVGTLVQRFPRLCFVVVGRGPQMDRLKQQVAQAGLQEWVHLLGALPPGSDALWDLYAAAKVFLLPSVREGLPNVFIEAGAFGTPAVGVHDGGVPEVVLDGETGLLARVDDRDGIAACLAELLGDAPKCQALGHRARQWIEAEFSMAAMAERSYAVLTQVVEAQRGRGGA